MRSGAIPGPPPDRERLLSLKDFRRVATRYDKLAIFLSGVALAKAIAFWLWTSLCPNHRRLLEPIGNALPAEAEAQYYAAINAMDVAA